MRWAITQSGLGDYTSIKRPVRVGSNISKRQALEGCLVWPESKHSVKQQLNNESTVLETSKENFKSMKQKRKCRIRPNHMTCFTYGISLSLCNKPRRKTLDDPIYQRRKAQWKQHAPGSHS